MALPANRAFPAGYPPVRAPRPTSGALRASLLALAGLCVIAVAARFLSAPLDRFDEGLTLTKAALVANGLVPYRDFWTTYGPLDTLVLGAAFHVIAVDALVERLLAVVSVLLFAGTAYTLITVIGVRGALRLLMTSLLAQIPLSIPAFSSAVLADLLLLGAFTAFLRGQLDDRRRWPLVAGALTALSSLARPELGAALGVGLLAGYALTVQLEGRLGPLLAYASSASLGVALLWGPVILAAGPAPIYLQLVQSTVTVYAGARRIPLGQGHEGPAVAIMACAYALTWLWALRTLARRSLAPAAVTAVVALLITGMLLFGWVWTRADGTHALTAWPPTGVLLVWLMHQRRRGLPLRPRVEAAMSVVALAGLALVAGALAGRDLNVLTGPGVLPRATLVGARAWMPPDRLAAIIRRIDAEVPFGQPIFVGLRRNDLVLFNDTTLYFLSDRRPGTVYFEDLPAFSNQDAVQRTVICQLVRSHVSLAVLGPNAAPEPWNRSSQPGSTRLDTWLAAHAGAQETMDPYQLVTLRQDSAALPGCP
jgi:hypothetical protein